MCKKYQGYSNYATCRMIAWMASDKIGWDEWRERAFSMLDTQVAQAIELEAMEALNNEETLSGFHSECLTWLIHEVNYQEIVNMLRLWPIAEAIGGAPWTGMK